MNSMGVFAALMTVALLISVGGSVTRSSDATRRAWMGMRSIYYSAGILVSGYYLSFLLGNHSTNLPTSSSLSWNNFVPLIFCIFGLLHTLFLWRSQPRTNEYHPQNDPDIVVSGDRKSS